MIKRAEIYFNDLEPEAQANLLKAFETTEEDENWDIFPIAVIEREVEVDDLYFKDQIPIIGRKGYL